VVSLNDYEPIVGAEVIGQLQRLAERLGTRSFVHVNSTKSGGGVAEILSRAVPLLNQVGLDVQWEVIQGDSEFFEVTKSFHNALQGEDVHLTNSLLEHYQEINRENARKFTWEADFVMIHDPQPAWLINEMRSREVVSQYDASVFSMARFAQNLPHHQYIIRPSIDPLSEKNRELTEEEIQEVLDRLNIERDKPIILQVSRFDTFKDPLGVIQAFRMVRKHAPCKLVLAGGEATDDPEGPRTLAEVMEAAHGEPDIHILLLPPNAHHDINALQRAADIILQKSTREGFGLTVTEAMWKGKPVIGGAVGGIVLQITDYNNGFLVNSPEGCAFRIRYLLHRPDLAKRMGNLAREFAREHFLITRTIRDYLTLLSLLENPDSHLIEL
jgi:trehalose synthase